MYKTFTQLLPMMPSTHTGNTRLISSLFTHWLRRFAGSFFLAWLLLVGQKAFASGVPAAQFLLPNGTLNTAVIGSQQLSLDLKGWNVTLDPTLGPVFAPTTTNGFSALGNGLMNGYFVNAIAISGSDVYVGGTFTGVGSGGTAVSGLNRIAKWNTTTATWSALGNGLNGEVGAIAVNSSTGDVYVGGDFTGVGSGGTAVSGLNRIAKWNTTTSAWSALGSGFNGSVHAIAVSGSDVYVGGAFTGVGGGTAVSGLNRIAKWNTTTSAWSALDKGLNYTVLAIAISGSDVYVGGAFTGVGSGGTAVSGLNYIAKWNITTATWSALGSGSNGTVRAIAVNSSTGDVYVGGEFMFGGFGNPGLNGIAKWNTTTATWSALDKGLNDAVFAIAISGSDVYVGGVFAGVGSGGTAVTGLNSIAKWNTTTATWSALGSGLNSTVSAIAVSGSDVYVGGAFTGVGSGGTAVSGLNSIAKWLAVATPTLTIVTAISPTNCTTPNGSIAFTSTGFAAGNQTLNYSKDGTPTSATVTIATNGTFTLTGLGAGDYTAFAIGATTATGNRTLEPLALPTITLAPIASVSTTATSFSIPYTATTGSPNQYSLVVGSPAMASFTPVSNVAFSGTSGTFSITIPASVANTYNFNLTVTNSTTGCVSAVIPVALTVTAPVANGPSCSTFTNKTTTNGLSNNFVLGVYAVGNTVYAGTYGGGLNISTDGGATFTYKTTINGLGNNVVRGVYAVGTTVYAATEGGLSISTDGGATFTNRTTTNGLGNNTVRGVYVVGTTVYAATAGGLSISTDGGATFTNRTTTSGLGNNFVVDVYAVGTTVYAATADGLSISTDGGATFTNRTTTNGLGDNVVRRVYAVGELVLKVIYILAGSLV